MYILGISAYYHDSAACLLKDGNIIAAAQEERFTRKKHDQDFPTNSIKYCLSEEGISASDLEIVAFYEKQY
jgi:carbamoyltransferase